MWIAFPSAKWSLKDPCWTGTLRFSPRTAAWVLPTQGSENRPSTDDPAEPANTYRSPFGRALLHFFFDLQPFLCFLLAAALRFPFLHFRRCFFPRFDLQPFLALPPSGHFTIAVVPGLWDVPEITVGELRTGARWAICASVAVTMERIEA